MSEIKRCTECKTIKSAKFRQLKGNKCKEADNNNLVKVTWTEGVVLCNICYMNFVENPLKRGSRRVKTTVDDDSGNVESATDDAATMMEILLENAKKTFFEL